MDSPEAVMIERGKRSGQAFVGVLLVALGLIFLADRADWGQLWGVDLSFRRLWPLLLILAGLGISFSPRDTEVVSTERDGVVQRETRVIGRRRIGDGISLIVTGLIMLAHVNSWMSLRHSWPLFIVAGGLSLIFGGGAAFAARRERR